MHSHTKSLVFVLILLQSCFLCEIKKNYLSFFTKDTLTSLVVWPLLSFSYSSTKAYRRKPNFSPASCFFLQRSYNSLIVAIRSSFYFPTIRF